MSGVQIHSQDPITPAKASGQASERIEDSWPNFCPSTTTVAASQQYPQARPGAAAPAPTPTSTVAKTTEGGPPPPQPGATPAPQPKITARPSVPPPPKFGEKPQPPEYYQAAPSQPVQPQPYPSQMSQPPLATAASGLPPASITSTTTVPSYRSTLGPTSLPASAETSSRTSLEHPPGYVQNPYASEMTPDQRFAMEQQDSQTKSEALPTLGYYDNSRKGSSAGAENDSTVFEAAVKWGKDRGKQFGDLHERLWDTIGRK